MLKSIIIVEGLDSTGKGHYIKQLVEKVKQENLIPIVLNVSNRDDLKELNNEIKGLSFYQLANIKDHLSGVLEEAVIINREYNAKLLRTVKETEEYKEEYESVFRRIAIYKISQALTVTGALIFRKNKEYVIIIDRWVSSTFAYLKPYVSFENNGMKQSFKFFKLLEDNNIPIHYRFLDVSLEDRQKMYHHRQLNNSNVKENTKEDIFDKYSFKNHNEMVYRYREYMDHLKPEQIMLIKNKLNYQFTDKELSIS